MKYNELVSKIDQAKVNIDACHKELLPQKGEDDATAADLRSVFKTLGTLMKRAGDMTGKGYDKADYEKDLNMDFSRRGVSPTVHPGSDLKASLHRVASDIEEMIEEINNDGKIVGDRTKPTLNVNDDKSWSSACGAIKKSLKAIREFGG